MSVTPSPRDQLPAYPNGRERVIVQTIHWGIVLLVIIAVVTLTMEGHMSDSSATALLGTVLGHAGTAAATKLQSRSGDSDDARSQG